jgi:hypothetical protein
VLSRMHFLKTSSSKKYGKLNLKICSPCLKAGFSLEAF